jgi:hypothetical protein
MMAQVPPANPVVVNPIIAPASQSIQQVLNDHDRTKRSTDILLFYGQQGRDTIPTCILIIRANDAATIAGWDNACKILQFKMCLRDKAVSWFKGLIEDGINVDNWDIVKAEFLESYKPKYLAKTTCANFTDLTQKMYESIHDYTYCNQIAYKCLTDNKPATMATARAAALTVQEAKAEGIADAFKIVRHQLFLAGLKDGICDKVLEATKATFSESVKAASNLETIQNYHKMPHRIAIVKAELPPDEAKEIIWENLTEQEIKPVAAIRARNNRFPPKRNNNPACNNSQTCTNSARNPNIVCRYWNKNGHLQKECFSRQRNNAPMVDANGKPYETNCVNNVAN